MGVKKIRYKTNVYSESFLRSERGTRTLDLRIMNPTL